MRWSICRAIHLVGHSPATDRSWVAAMRDIRRRGVHNLAVLLAANSFGDGAPTARPVEPLASGIPTHLLSYGQDISAALSHVPLRCTHITVFAWAGLYARLPKKPDLSSRAVKPGGMDQARNRAAGQTIGI